ncbi:MAG TPA: pitrilysin family protein [Bryobacteraceae bacterium]|nr:pitrilysin family protein [Bryobacteraceae bacterium]
MSRFITLFIVAAAAAVTLTAQTAKQTPPPPGPARPFHFPKYETKKLANGLTVFVIEDHRQPLVSYRLDITTAGGSATEASKAGLADLTAGLLRQGTKTRTAQQIANVVDSSGGSLGASATLDVAQAFSTMMKSSSALGLELLSDIVQNPTFPQDEFDRLMRQSLSGLQVTYNDPQNLAQVLAYRTAYGAHSYAMPTDGTPDTMRKLKRDDVISFYQSHYGPAYAYLAIAGDVTPSEAFASAEKYFGAWKGNVTATAMAKPPASVSRRIVVVDKPDAVQTQYAILQTMISRSDPDYVPLQVANQIFGGSFNSRLNMKLRANEGLTYGATSALEPLRQTGVFTARSFSRTEKTATAIKMMADLLKEYRENPVTESELQEAKAYLAGSFALSVETPADVAQRVLIAAINGLPADYWDTYRDRILAATAEQVKEAVQRHLTPDKMDIVAAGNAAGFAKDLEGLGKVQVIPLADLDLTAENLTRPKESAPVTGESKARGLQLIQQAVDAVGGRQALEAVNNISSKGPVSISMGGQTMKASLEEVVLFPDKYKMTMSLPFGNVIQAWDGKVAWVQQGPQTRELPANMAKEVERSMAMVGGVGLLRSAVDGKAEVNATGDNTVVWTSGEEKVTVVFDPASKRIAKLTYRGVGPQGPADNDVEYSDYRQVEGVYLPFHEIVIINGQKFGEREFTERKINGEVKPEIFAKPAA